MSKKTETVDVADVLAAFDRLQDTINAWKRTVAEAMDPDTRTISYARGPFPPGPPVTGPPPPFTGCHGEFLVGDPHVGCLDFDIDTYVQQTSEYFKSIYYGLEHDLSGPSKPKKSKPA